MQYSNRKSFLYDDDQSEVEDDEINGMAQVQNLIETKINKKFEFIKGK